MTLIDNSLQNIRFSKVNKFLKQGSKILDVGCENGELFLYLRNKIENYIGIDVNTAPQKIDTFCIVNGSFPEDLPSGIQELDAIIMLAVVEHFHANTLAKLNRSCQDILRRGGLIIMTIPSPFVDKILHLLQAIKIVHANTLHEHHGFSPSEIKNYISEKDFDLVCHKKFELGLNNLFVFKKK